MTGSYAVAMSPMPRQSNPKRLKTRELRHHVAIATNLMLL
jgi:hypothetical protein